MVGLVTKYAGGVVKGFALIAGTKAQEISFFLVTIINHLVVPILTAPLFYSNSRSDNNWISPVDN